MPFVHFKMGVACLFVLVYLIFYYFKSKRIHTRPTVLYRLIIGAAFVNVIFDTITVYTVNQLVTVAPTINRLCHQIFIASVNVFLYLVCRYILSITQNNHGANKLRNIILAIPLCVAFCFILFAPLYYATPEGYTAYSYGPMANTCYASVGLYLILAIYFLIRYWKEISKEKREAILPILLLMACSSGIQLFYPTVLLSAAGITIVCLGIFMSLENPREYLSDIEGIFNRKGFEIKMDDIFTQDKPYVALAFTYQHLVEEYSKRKEDAVLKELNGFCTGKYKLDLFMTIDGCVMLFCSDLKRVDGIEQEIREWLKQKSKQDEIFKKMDIEVNKYKLGVDFTNREELLNLIIVFMENSQKSIAFFDQSIGIKNRNAFEKTRQFIDHNLSSYSSIWCALIDVNDLKVINDQYGHAQGDLLLQNCADILVNATKSLMDVYRIGGDEFLVLQMGKNQKEHEELLQRIELELQKTNAGRSIPLEFAIGYSTFNPSVDTNFADLFKRVDMWMYEDKCQKKRIKKELLG